MVIETEQNSLEWA